MKRFCLSRKKWTQEQADQQIQNCFQAISANIDNINYWRQRIGKPLEFIDSFILGVDGFKTPEQFIKMSIETIEYLHRKIYEDYGRYVKVRNKLG